MDYVSRVDDVIDALEPLLPAGRVEDLRSDTHAGEWHLAMGSLVRNLAVGAVAITPGDLANIAALWTVLGNPTRALDSLVIATDLIECAGEDHDGPRRSEVGGEEQA